MPYMKRRAFITLLGGAAAAWPLAARAQQPAMPVIGFLNGQTPDEYAHLVAAFLQGVNQAGYVEGQNVAIEYRWAQGQFDRLPAMAADLIGRNVAVIAATGSDASARAAKAATSMIPIVFTSGADPVTSGLVASLNRPGGNVTGIHFLAAALGAKRLGLLHDLVPKATRIAVLVNPANARVAEVTLRDTPKAARAIGLQIQVLNASTNQEIEAAFATIVRDRADALFIPGDGFFSSRRSQFVTLAARDRIPTSCSNRQMVEAGLLMSYGTNTADMFRQVGMYTANILKGAKPADLPVVQSTKFEFVINMQAARALGIEVPPQLLASADEAIE
jgi:putative tryptophan/tyrosine transport system substrate-binding protein